MKFIYTDKIDGKTIKAHAESYGSDSVLLIFDDGTYTHFQAKRCWDSELIECDPVGLFDFGDDELIACGFITREELDRQRPERDAKLKERYEANDRKHYEELKKMFEPN